MFSSIRWRRAGEEQYRAAADLARQRSLGHSPYRLLGPGAVRAGLANGQGAAAPALLAATDPQGDYAFLNLAAPAFDLTDRGVAGRPAPNGLDAFVYAERGVYRSGETAYLTALLRDPAGAAAINVPLTLVVERPDGVEYKRALRPGPGSGRL